MKERRQPPPAVPLGYIDRLPARTLLNRLPVPMWAVHEDEIVYANPAFEEMLGYCGDCLGGAAAADLIAADTSEGMPVTVLLRQRAGELLGLRHAGGSIIKVIVSAPMLLRGDDPVILTGVQDVTEYVWEKSL